MAAALQPEPRYDPRVDEVEALDARLATLARSAAPLRRAVARVAGGLVEARSWEPLVFARLADYARERPGLSARELHDLAHVDAALAELPAIDAALAGGRLGWTKARLLGRVAMAGDEARWLEVAGRLSAAALAREVRGCDVGAGAQVAPDDEPGEREALRVRVPQRVLAKWGHVKRTLRCVAGEWLPTETCAELVAAEVLSAVRLDTNAARPPAPSAALRMVGACDPGPGPEALAAAAPVPTSPFVAALTDGLDAAGPRDLDARLRRAAALEQGLLVRLGPLLLAFVAAGGPAAFGFRGLDGYARERLAMSPRKARALLRVERACVRSAPLAAAWRSGRLSWSQAQALVLAPGSEPFHEAWLARAGSVTMRRLQDDVDFALASGEFDPALLPQLPTGVQIGARPMLQESNETWVANVPADVGRLFRACLHTVQRRLDASPGTALEAMFDRCIATWRARPGRPPAEHRVFERDGWRCTVPGCTSQRNLHAHHVVFRSAGGSDEDANLTTLCALHHQRGVHAGVIRVSGRAPDGLVFELPLGRFGSGDLVLPPTAGRD
jgi:hypothetical protein